MLQHDLIRFKIGCTINEYLGHKRDMSIGARFEQIEPGLTWHAGPAQAR
jgi:hypothetical protein